MASCIQVIWFCVVSRRRTVKVMMRRFFRRRVLKLNSGEGKVMVLNGEEELECEMYVNRIRLDF